MDLSRDLNHEYILSDSLPEGMTLADPSRFTEDRIGTIWDHWLQRQAKESQGLVFIKAKPGAIRDLSSQSLRHQRQYGEDSEDEEDDNNNNNGEDDDDTEDENDNGEGPSNLPQDQSPAAHAESTESKMAFLRSLSLEYVYQQFINKLESMEEVSMF
jgi:cobalamin biosynthesis protein CobT